MTVDAGAVDERYYFLIRRLHSLTGIVPVGTFLCVHLSVNATIMAGPNAFQFAVDQIHNLNKLGILKAVEVLFIFMPIAFHAIVGVVIWLSGRPNVMAYQYCGNVRYMLQRITGIIALVFILVHLWQVHWIIPSGTQFDPHSAAQSVVALLDRWWTGPLYALGVISAVYHLANGIWTSLITWGITISPNSQKLSAYACIVIGLMLGLMGLGSLRTIKTMDTSTLPPPAAATESHATGVDDGAPLLA